VEFELYVDRRSRAIHFYWVHFTFRRYVQPKANLTPSLLRLLMLRKRNRTFQLRPRLAQPASYALARHDLTKGKSLRLKADDGMSNRTATRPALMNGLSTSHNSVLPIGKSPLMATLGRLTTKACIPLTSIMGPQGLAIFCCGSALREKYRCR
jgi:hypothetical protein